MGDGKATSVARPDPSNLVKRTFLSKPLPRGAAGVGYVSWFSFPDGGQEVSAVVLPHIAEGRTSKARRGRASDGERRRENAERASRRGKVSCRRLVRLNGCRYMLTLTFGHEGEHVRRAAVILAREWVRDSRTAKFLGGCYIMVPELHPSGHGWHIHILTPHRIPIEQVRVSWTRFLQRRGYSSPTGRIQVNAKYWGSSAAAAAYASKYVTKSFGTPSPARFGHSQESENDAALLPYYRQHRVTLTDACGGL